MLLYEFFFKYSHIYIKKLSAWKLILYICVNNFIMNIVTDINLFYFKQTISEHLWKYFIFSFRLLITLKFMIIYNYSKIRFHICIKCMIIESDKKIMEFFHKPHLYWDLWKYFILPIKLLITLESTTKWYYWYQNKSHFHQLHKYGVW